LAKNKYDAIINFNDDMSAENVTGSCTYLELQNTNILLECGSYQGKGLKTNYKINNRNFRFKVKDVDYLILGHFHNDHSGLIPRLIAEGFNGKILVPDGSVDIIKEMWLDSAYINRKDVEYLNSKYKKKNYKPTYNEQDVYLALDYIEECPFNKKIDINSDFSFEFLHSGHIINSASIMIYLDKGRKKIYYTSDMGSEITTSYFADKLDKIDNATVVISEATYSDHNRVIKPEYKKEDIEKMDNIICSSIEQNGKILIPAFSLNRTQDVLMFLYENGFTKKIDVYVDSPLSQRVSKIYKTQYPKFDKAFKSAKWTYSSDESKMINRLDKPAIIISASGMCEAGRVVHHLQNMISDSNNHIVFCGFSANNTLAARIKNKDNKTVSIFKRQYKKNANIVELKSFSSHIQNKELKDYLSQINCETIILKHSEQESKLKFAKELQQYLDFRCNTANILCADKRTEIKI
jgi:metallo-beta-lactamase family protein